MMKAMKKYALLIVISTIVLSALIAIINQSYSATPNDSEADIEQSSLSHKPQLIIGDRYIDLLVAHTDTELATGLSGKNSLAQNKAMLFIFPHSDYWAMWMKDMKFPLDIVWLDAGYRIITVKANLSPNTYPQAFMPTAPAAFVLETPAGATEAWHLAPNQKLDIVF